MLCTTRLPHCFLSGGEQFREQIGLFYGAMPICGTVIAQL